MPTEGKNYRIEDKRKYSEFTRHNLLANDVWKSQLQQLENKSISRLNVAGYFQKKESGR